MQRVIRSIFVLFLLGFFTVASGQLPPEIRVDAYLLQVEQAIRDGDLDRARTVIQNIRNLQEQHELDLPDEFHFRYAKAAISLDLPDQALESVEKYLAASGREGQHSLEALTLMNKIQDRSSGDVVASQLSPNIIADTYMLQAEQTIRDGDHNQARDAIQNIRNLQEQHELDLPDEFHFRYAKATDVLDMPDQALESILKYLAVSGREGQHYVEALALMNKVQTAVSCKGWDTEDYFKTATLEEVTACLDTGVDLNARDDAGVTPLHRAVKNTENPDVIKALINAGADKDVRDNDKRTPLHGAVAFNILFAVKALIEAGADLDVQDKDKQTPLHYAMKNTGNLDVIKALIEAGANLEAQDKDKRTPLGYAVSFRHSAAIKILIEAGADRERVEPSWGPLHWAAAYNENSAAIKALLNAGADLKAKDEDKRTPLHIAAVYNENPDVVKSLIQAGADLKAKEENNYTPLHCAAAYNKNPAIVKSLIDAGADLEARNKDNWTPLHCVAASGVDRFDASMTDKPAVVKILIDAGADLEARSKYSRRPLHLAAWGKPGVVKVLIDAGANLEAQGYKDKTALTVAMETGDNAATIKLLRDAGARKLQQGDGFGKAAAALLGGAAIMYAGKDAADQEVVTEAVREYMEGVLSEQPDGNINSAGTSSQTQGGQAQGTMQQALQNLENVCGEKYQGNFADNDHYRFYCMAAFNDYCALKRAQSSEAISKLRASLQQNCAVLKSVGADSKCSYCK